MLVSFLKYDDIEWNIRRSRVGPTNFKLKGGPTNFKLKGEKGSCHSAIVWSFTWFMTPWQRRNSWGQWGKSFPTLLTGKFLLTYREKRGKEKGGNGENFSKPLKFVLGLPKWEFSTDKKKKKKKKKNISRRGKKQDRWLRPLWKIFLLRPASWGGTYTLKRVSGIYSGKDPLFTLPQPLHKTPFSAFFRSTRSSFQVGLPKITKFQHFSFKMPNYMANFQFLILKMGQNPIQGASVIWAKNQFWKQHVVKKKNQFNKRPNLAPIRFTSPRFRSFKPLTPT